MKIVFMGSSEFAVPALESLINSTDHDVIAVYTRAPKPAGRGKKESYTPIHKLALANNIRVYTPKTFKTDSEINICQEVREFERLQADIAVVASYGLILTKDILNAPRYGAINIHPSKLPRWRGAAPIHRTIMAGDKITEVNIMQMDEGLDTGDILMRKEVEVSEQITTGELQCFTAEIGADMVLDVLDDIKNNRLKPIKQSNKGIKYAEKITKCETRISWDESAKQINNLIRACSPFPGANFIYKNQIIKIYSIEIMSTDMNYIKKLYKNHKPGMILSNDLDIGCKNGVIRPFVIQREGKKPMHVDKFLLGFKFKVGDILI